MIRRVRIAFGSGSGFDAERGSRRSLSGSQCIVLVICDDIGQIDIFSASTHKVTESDSVSISISAIGDDRKIRVG